MISNDATEILLMSSKILVTGGAGYIGQSHMQGASRGQLHSGRTGDDQSTGIAGREMGAVGSERRRDRAADLKVLEEFEIRAVVHFAAYAYVGESIGNPVSTSRTTSQKRWRRLTHCWTRAFRMLCFRRPVRRMGSRRNCRLPKIIRKSPSIHTAHQNCSWKKS